MPPLRLLHSHTHSMRLATGEEALVVRVLAEGGHVGFGFTFVEDVGAARDMATWHAAAATQGRALSALLATAPGEAAALGARAPAPGHPWADAWGALLAGADTAIDWGCEPGFAGLRWRAASSGGTGFEAGSTRGAAPCSKP